MNPYITPILSFRPCTHVCDWGSYFFFHYVLWSASEYEFFWRRISSSVDRENSVNKKLSTFWLESFGWGLLVWSHANLSVMGAKYYLEEDDFYSQ